MQKIQEKTMARGGYRKGAGRKKEYNEPVKNILIGLPQSVLTQLDDYASEKRLSRPKAIASILQEIKKPNPVSKKEKPLSKKEKKVNILKELKALRAKSNKS